jgi:hypothetical protein
LLQALDALADFLDLTCRHRRNAERRPDPEGRALHHRNPSAAQVSHKVLVAFDFLPDGDVRPIASAGRCRT